MRPVKVLLANWGGATGLGISPRRGVSPGGPSPICQQNLDRTQTLGPNGPLQSSMAANGVCEHSSKKVTDQAPLKVVVIRLVAVVP